MNTNIDFKELWNMQKATAPDTKALFEKANQYKRKSFRKLVLANVTLLLTAAFILFIWYSFTPELMTSKIGILCIVIAVMIYLFVYNKTAAFLRANTTAIDINQYLKGLLRLKEKQKYLQTTILNLYFVLLSTGIGLYMYEYTSQMKTSWALIAYGLTIAWIALNWFVLRPMTIKKEEKKLNELIEKFKNINQQLSENE